ncbi:tyrosine recombinase XerC (plasmid) [Francisella halioticida]|uniref:tyrosine-type recombinase/integrase n=1 Tax=Francisella halioticida TaxID=549298 RepID=UPI001AF7B1BA|nr:tyrosine-type recombinase/integrase [Francisella halioticida]BCD92644.1 tyrosine recombinase XerC [Francisella halioticida]
MKNIIEFDRHIPDYKNLIEEYKKHLIYSNCTKSTVDTYIIATNKFIEFLEVPLNELDYIHIIHYKSELQDRLKQKAATINKKLQALKRFISYLYNNNYIKSDMSKNIPFIKIQKQSYAPEGLTYQEINLLLQFAGSNSKQVLKLRNYTMIQLLLGTGIRLDELVNLDYRDIIINDRSGHLLVRKGKGDKERAVLLSSKVRNSLNIYFDYRVKKYKLDQLNPDDPVIANQSNKRMTPRSVQKVIKSLADKAKITRIQVTPHTFRHTFANRYFQSTKDILSLQALLGHEDLNTTGWYAKPTQKQLLDSMDLL